jgi:hypothetical protein
MNSFHFRERGGFKLPRLYTLPINDFDLRATHARKLLPAALASVSFGFVLVRVREKAHIAPQKPGPQTPIWPRTRTRAWWRYLEIIEPHKNESKRK